MIIPQNKTIRLLSFIWMLCLLSFIGGNLPAVQHNQHIPIKRTTIKKRKEKREKQKKIGEKDTSRASSEQVLPPSLYL